MTWLESRDKISRSSRSSAYAVFRVAPRNIDSDDISVVLSPPGRDLERYKGGQVDTDYHQRLMVSTALGDDNDDEAADAVELAVEAITDASTRTSPRARRDRDRAGRLGRAFVDKYPPGGTVDFVIMAADVSITKNVDVGA